MTISVAYQGERGAFSEAAAVRLLGREIEPLPCASFDEMFAAVDSEAADCCVAPIENSLAGSIHRNYDLLLASRLTIGGETHLRIVHNLIARRDVPLTAIRRVYSHPVALAQCTRFLRANPSIEAVPVHDTAGGVRQVIERGRDDEAGIASAEAAGIYGGHIVASAVEDHTANFTRFLLLAPREREIETHETPRRWKTSMVFRVANKPGSLHRALGAFAMFDLDLAKIESRPIEGRPWEYAFYVDVIGRESDPDVTRALDNLQHIAEMVRVLGSYRTKW
ncbi:MAG TPA: prephenate dehydratase [Thermoanaerobaculia bacterium]|nr:prephenate dehydratase [Thermoanaerobaculia bacterium]